MQEDAITQLIALAKAKGWSDQEIEKLKDNLVTAGAAFGIHPYFIAESFVKAVEWEPPIDAKNEA